LLSFGRLLTAYFVGDDFAFIGRYATFPFSDWPGLFTHTWQAGLFAVDLREIRPLNALAFMIDARLWGAEPFGYRLTNLLLHAGCATLVGALGWEISRTRRVAVLATLLFALHPIAVPAVGWISGRVDVLSTLFMLGAVLALVRWRLRAEAGRRTLAALGFCLAAALFTKESALVFAGLMVVLDFALGVRWRDARAWPPYATALGVIILYAICRQIAFGVAGPSGIGQGQLPTSATGLLRELLDRQTRYAPQFFPPVADWLVGWRDAGFPRTGPLFYRVLGPAIVMLGAAAAGGVWWQRSATPALRRRLLGLGLGWYCLTTLPLVVTYFSARHLYPTLVGFSLVVAMLAHAWVPARRTWVISATGILVGLAFFQQVGLSSWLRAAERSRAMSQAVQAVARDAAPGTVLLVDAPAYVDRAFCWSWAVPHALRPPFTATPLDARLVVVPRPSAYAYREEWRQDLPLATLAQSNLDALVIDMRGDGTIVTRIVAAHDLRRAAHDLQAKREDDDATWAAFLRALR